MSDHGHFHLHKRHRTQHGEPFHSTDRLKKYVDRTCYFFSILMPLTTIPQIHLIYSEHEVSGVSLSMWILYCIGVIPFFLYGIIHKERQLVILNSLWMIAQVVVIVGILMYR